MSRKVIKKRRKNKVNESPYSLGSIMLARTTGGMFVVGAQEKPGGALVDVYQLANVRMPTPGTVSTDLFPLMYPISKQKSDVDLSHFLVIVPAPDWIANKYLELVTGIVLAEALPPGNAQLLTRPGVV